MPTLRDKLLHNIHQQHLVLPDSTLVVAVSGGADSMALLHLLSQLQERLHCTLHVATLDHGLRGEAGAGDAQFVREKAEAWGLAVTVGKADLAPNAKSIETRAREVRYRFLIDTARRVGANRIATAHHADDQAETVLMHIIRGGGVRGLAGMAYSSQLSAFSDQFRVQSLESSVHGSELSVSENEDYHLSHASALSSQHSTLTLQPSSLTLIRPMLNITRAEIEAYCMEHSIEYRHDTTNNEPNTLRNILRLQTLLHLRELNPQIVPALNRLGEIASIEDDYLEWETRRFIDSRAKIEAARVTLELKAYRNLHVAMQRRVIQKCWEIVGAQRIALFQREQTLSFENIGAAVNLMKESKVGAVAQLPGGLQVRMGYAEVYVERADVLESYDGWLLPEGFERQLAVPESVDLTDGWWLTIEAERTSQPSLTLIIPLNASVTLRTRRPGDKIAPKGMQGHTRKLKEWMIDRKIPQKVRDRVPLLVVNGQIAAVLSHPEFVVTEPFIKSYNLVTSDDTYIYVTVAKI
jgi:tRNA(Ile)-lysidine synthetase-like protein